MSVITYDVRGLREVRQMLRQYAHPILTKRMKQATKAGGNALRAPLKAESRKVSQRMGRAVTVKQSTGGLEGASHLPRVREPHVYVGYRTKAAFFSNFVIYGTKDHGPRKAPLMVFRAKNGATVRTKRVRGVRANPIVSRVASSHEGQAFAAVVQSITSTETR